MSKRKPSPLARKFTFFKPKQRHSQGWSETSSDSREAEKGYKRRLQFDKVVRTTHGVNCTGSCSWKVFVKDGIITWENQQTDYPTTGPDMPEYEPRGCPRGATFSWYTYSPLRIRYPYVRSDLLSLWKGEYKKTKDPVQAWANIVNDPQKANQYKEARGKGGFVRASWDEVNELIASALIHNISIYGPDRIAGFSPIPAMSMVSHAAGARFLSLLGSPILSFYDWYADLPPASPQIWGEQTDVPESSDWFNAGYLIVWGSNLPQTRTPDAHFMVEARYKGTKVVAVAPDYAEYVKFADNWLNVEAGMDGALAMAMTHVILKEFYVDQQPEYFQNYAKNYTDLPFLITVKKRGEQFVADRFLRASDLGSTEEKADWKTIILDKNSNQFYAPNGSIGYRWDGEDRWNLHMENDMKTKIEPVLTLLGQEDEVLPLQVPYFNENDTSEVINRSVPVKKIENNGKTIYVTTVLDLMIANAGVDRGLIGDYPKSYEDDKPYTPLWQEKITGVKKELVAQVAREFAQNALDTKGRSMIVMGSGINHWYNSDVIYRSVLNLVLLTGSQGVNGGGWAHYVGQEKVRPLEGWGTVAMARDWGGGPPRLQNGTSFFYFLTEQWRFEEIPIDNMKSPLVDKTYYNHPGDYNVLAARLGWLPSYPQFNENPLRLEKKAKQNGATTNEEVIDYLAKQLQKGELRFSIEEPDNPINFPKALFVWRANLIGSSSKGHEYFLKYMLGTEASLQSEENLELKPDQIDWTDEAATGKLDLLINIDFRMAGTGLYSDIVLPAATWYEKTDISSTDMHPFIHPFNPAIAPPWEARSDWDTFKKLAKTFTEMARKYLPNKETDVVTTPLLHDSPDELAQPLGKIYDWKKDGTVPVPGVNAPRFHLVERDYTKIYEKMISLGPNVKKSIGAKGISWQAEEEYKKLQDMLGTVGFEGEFKDCPSLLTDRNVAETILTLSSTTNGSLAMKAFEAMEKKTNLKLKDMAEERAEEHISFAEITAQPRKVITSPVFSGTETGNRRYSPFTQNVERLIPWRTLTGRQHFYLDHELMFEFGESLPVFKPPLPKQAFYQQDHDPKVKDKTITLRYLTPHFKWSYHSTYGDTLPMLTLFRGGPHVWLNNEDAEKIDLKDNDWLEMYNRNGVVVARAVLSHRMPRGIAYMYHVQERHINVPKSPITKTRGGTFNSPTKIHIKPTQMIGGYAQLSYGFNYFGPNGSQRDGVVAIRKLEEVSWDES